MNVDPARRHSPMVLDDLRSSEARSSEPRSSVVSPLTSAFAPVLGSVNLLGTPSPRVSLSKERYVAMAEEGATLIASVVDTWDTPSESRSPFKAPGRSSPKVRPVNPSSASPAPSSRSSVLGDFYHGPDGARSNSRLSKRQGMSKAHDACSSRFSHVSRSPASSMMGACSMPDPGGLSVHSVAPCKSSTFSDGARSIATLMSVQSKGKSRAPGAASYPRFFAVTPTESDGSFNSNCKSPGFRGIQTAELPFVRSRTFGLSNSNDQASQVPLSPPLGQTSVPRTKTSSNEPALSAGPEDTASHLEGSTFQTGTMAIRIKESYHWCATVGVLLILQLIFDSIGHQFQYVPQASDWCCGLLLLYCMASVFALRFASSVRPYAPYLLAFGSLCMTCQVSWHWHSQVAQVKDSLLQQPVLLNVSSIRSINNSTAASFQSDAIPSSLYASLYESIFGASALDFLDTATFLVVLFLHCVQSSFLCRLGSRIAATVSVLQWTVLVCWPLTSPHLHASWVCRIGATGIWTVHLIRSAYVWESEAKHQAAYIDNLLHSLAEGRKTITEVRKALKDGQTADSVLNHMLKNTMADASGCIDLYCHERPHGEDVAYLSKASDGLFRGMWWCKLREAVLRMVAGQYESEPEVVNLHQFAEDFVRGRDVELECPLHVVMLDPMACNVILDNAVTNATRHGCQTNPEVKLTARVSEQSHNADAAMIDSPVESEIPVEVRFTITNRADSSSPAVKRWSTQQPNEPQQSKSPNSPVLSDGLGLSHIWMVANRAEMVAELSQNGDKVHFELYFQTTALPPETSLLPQRAGIVSLSPRWEVLGLDDSGIARKSLVMNLEKALPDANVQMYGKDAAEVEEFERAALERADVIILDQNIDVDGQELYGSTILTKLRKRGYRGFACVRSGNSAQADKELSLKSGAQWHVGKEVPIPEMIRQLRREYDAFMLNQENESRLGARSIPSSLAAADDNPLARVCRFDGTSSCSGEAVRP
uniref:Response regulatory domain-containing protein n=1 Tax=Eutreptiella gymnastica TaxID=73025 RepID=A0A6T2J226_9EUGL